LDRRLEGTSDQFDVLQMLFSSTLHLLMTGQVRVNNLDQERVSQ